VSTKLKHKNFKFTLTHFIRIFLFALFLYSSVSYLSTAVSQKKYSTSSPALPAFLSQAYQNLTPEYQKKIEAIQKSPEFEKINLTYLNLLSSLNGLPQNIVKNIQKYIINSIYQDMMKKIEPDPTQTP
jgi:hypothetical protein